MSTPCFWKQGVLQTHFFYSAYSILLFLSCLFYFDFSAFFVFSLFLFFSLLFFAFFFESSFLVFFEPYFNKTCFLIFWNVFYKRKQLLCNIRFYNKHYAIATNLDKGLHKTCLHKIKYLTLYNRKIQDIVSIVKVNTIEKLK